MHAWHVTIHSGYNAGMNLALIEAFSAVMKTGSTTRAATLLGISQPAVSRAVRRLEDTTKLKLFERSGPRITPTPEALLFYREIVDNAVGMDRLRQAVVRIREVGTGSLKIASSAAMGLSFLPNVITAFLNKHPDVAITFEIASSSTVRNLVASGQFDIGLCADEIDASNLISELFVASRAVCVMRRDHSLSGNSVIRPRDLNGVAFIGLAPEDTSRKALQDVLNTARVQPRFVVETAFSSTVCQLALNGAGVGLANSFAYAAGSFDKVGLVARPFEPQILFRTLLVLPPQRARSRLVDEFIGIAGAQRDGVLAALSRLP